jgi:hypothetical protein
MAGVFVHPELVIEPGIGQFSAAGLILAATIGITFSLQARFADSALADYGTRLGLAALSLLILLCPDERIGAAACVPVLFLIGYWFVRRRNATYVTDGGPQLVDPIPDPSHQMVDTERGRMQ